MSKESNTETILRPELQRLLPLFQSLSDDNLAHIPPSALEASLIVAGLTRDDSRLQQLFADLDTSGEAMNLERFAQVIASSSILVERAVSGSLVIPDFQIFSRHIQKIFQAVAQNTGGDQARYIPPLADVNPDQFGLSIVTVDGQLFKTGDAAKDFSIQSTCKPFNYCFALEELGEKVVHQHIGREPSGQRFNAYVLQDDNRPHNPMINAGAIMCAGLVRLDLPLHRRFAHIRECWSQLTGGPIPRFNAFMAQEEARTGDRNRALAYMMKNEGTFPRGQDAEDHQIRSSLDLYFRACSLEMNCIEMATAAATLARGGICPTTERRVLRPETVRSCLSLMHSCGMYDFSGEFAFSIGIPAKSGVGGSVVLVVPGVMGVCVWSPRLDHIGNSVRGVDFARRLGNAYALHMYDSNQTDKQDPRVSVGRQRARRVGTLLWAATTGDLRSIRRMKEDDVNLSEGDYDKRTALHLAAAEGSLEVVRFLLSEKVNPNSADRWGGTPLDDAVLSGHQEVAELLREHGSHPQVADRRSSTGETSESTQAIEEPRHSNPEDVFELLWASATGDLTCVRRMLASGVYLGGADYDGRSALHLAAAEGQETVARYLIAHGHPIHCWDRWGNSPIDDARRGGHEALIEMLTVTETA